MFTVEIDTDGEAFKPTPDIELARILRVLSYRLEEGETGGKIKDGNGRPIGRFKLK